MLSNSDLAGMIVGSSFGAESVLRVGTTVPGDGLPDSGSGSDEVGGPATGGSGRRGSRAKPYEQTQVQEKPLKEETSSRTVQYKDVGGHWAESSIRVMTGLGVFNGYPGGEFKPERPMNRAEFAVGIARAAKLAGKISEGRDDGRPQVFFADRQDIPQWAGQEIEVLASKGIIKGYPDGTFKPYNEITRLEACLILARVFDDMPEVDNASSQVLFEDMKVFAESEKAAVSYLANRGVVVGFPDQTFRPHRHLTRAEACVLFWRAVKAFVQAELPL